ncbi:MAG: membrane-anchored protein [Leptolyngbya foveolarum]|uniref:Membrane-anchored protein n=1 Tax=Leptolyngbya foveolarum TaxID=47253 RepID=A0A2W4UJG9_9CYAN|nr:MAG: membrane-anchored protein [Leptolyngbya foveolarum]
MSSPTLSNSGAAIASTPPSAPRFLAGRFWAAMLLQSALIVAVPFQSFMTYTNGQTVTLQTAPVDPYDLIRGYSQTLGFDISAKETLIALPGGQSALGEGQEVGKWVYVTLQAPADAKGDVPAAWEPVAVSRDRPLSLPQNQVALKGRNTGWQVEYGLETYYMPESQRNDINAQIDTIQRSENQAFVVDVKVDNKGNSVPVSLWVGNQQYQF